MGRPAVSVPTWRPSERHHSPRQPAGSFQPLEQEAIGILGVNLIYAAFYQLESRESFFVNIAQDLDKRIEIDYAEVIGPAFEGWNQRAILVQLVCTGLAEAVCFPCSGPPVPPLESSTKRLRCSRQGPSNTWIPLMLQSTTNCWPPESNSSVKSYLKINLS